AAVAGQRGALAAHGRRVAGVGHADPGGGARELPAGGPWRGSARRRDGALMHGGRLLAKALAAHGVRYLFGLCGDHINAIFDGCADEGIPIIDTRHEAAAVHMAEGWSLATGSPGVACVTGGPGLMNAITPIADAKLAGIPLVVITSSIRQNEVGKGYPQDMDQLSVVRSVTSFAETVRHPDAVLAAVDE